MRISSSLLLLAASAIDGGVNADSVILPAVNLLADGTDTVAMGGAAFQIGTLTPKLTWAPQQNHDSGVFLDTDDVTYTVSLRPLHAYVQN